MWMQGSKFAASVLGGGRMASPMLGSLPPPPLKSPGTNFYRRLNGGVWTLGVKKNLHPFTTQEHCSSLNIRSLKTFANNKICWKYFSM